MNWADRIAMIINGTGVMVAIHFGHYALAAGCFCAMVTSGIDAIIGAIKHE